MSRRGRGRRRLLVTSGFDVSSMYTVCVGDSITYGTGSTTPGGATSYPSIIGAVNYGVPSLTTRDLPDVDYLLSESGPSRLIVSIGVNDIHAYGDTADDTFARLSAYVSAREAAGWLVVVCTLTGAPAIVDAGKQAEADDYNDQIRNGFTYVADVAADPDIGYSASGGDPNFALDGIHLKDAGYIIMAGIIHGVGASAPVASKNTDDGPVAGATLKAWYRDFRRLDKLVTNWEVGPWYNMMNPPAETAGRLITSGSIDPPYRVDSAIGGKSAVRFSGVSLARFVTTGIDVSEFVNADEFVIHVVCNVSTIATDNATLRFNDGVISGGNGIFGLHLKSTDSTLIGYVFGVGPAENTVTLTGVPTGTDTVLSLRLYDGKVGIRIGTSGSWTEASSGDLYETTGPFRIGSEGTGSYLFNGDVAEVLIRDTFDDDELTADMAYLTARYGL